MQFFVSQGLYKIPYLFLSLLLEDLNVRDISKKFFSCFFVSEIVLSSGTTSQADASTAATNQKAPESEVRTYAIIGGVCGIIVILLFLAFGKVWYDRKSRLARRRDRTVSSPLMEQVLDRWERGLGSLWNAAFWKEHYSYAKTINVELETSVWIIFFENISSPILLKIKKILLEDNFKPKQMRKFLH